MSSVRIVTDSAADIDAETARELGISVVPMTVTFGSEVYLHTELSNDEFWSKTAEGLHPGTSQPSIGLFEQAYARLVQAGHDVLCLTVTGKHSGTFSSAWAAARRFGDRIHVEDSLSLSLGQGFQVLAAARAALEGFDLAQVTQVVRRVQERSRLFILLDSIEHVQRGGRASALMPALNRVTQFLRIKPILGLSDGRLSLHGMARSYERGLSQIKHEIAQVKPFEQLAVIHTRCMDVAKDVANALAEKVAFPLPRIVVAETGPVLSVHGGPKVIGIAGVQQED